MERGLKERMERKATRVEICFKNVEPGPGPDDDGNVTLVLLARPRGPFPDKEFAKLLDDVVKPAQVNELIHSIFKMQQMNLLEKHLR